MAEDIVSETFLKAIKGIDRFKGDCEMRVWLCQIAKNTYYTFYQKEKKQQDIQQQNQDVQIETIEKGLIAKESAFEIHKALHEMEEPWG